MAGKEVGIFGRGGREVATRGGGTVAKGGAGGARSGGTGATEAGGRPGVIGTAMVAAGALNAAKEGIVAFLGGETTGARKRRHAEIQRSRDNAWANAKQGEFVDVDPRTGKITRVKILGIPVWQSPTLKKK